MAFSFKPLLRPINKIKFLNIEILLKTVYEVFVLSIFPRKFIKVILTSLWKIFFTYQKYNIFKNRTSFRICNSIKVCHGHISVLYDCFNWMIGRIGILLISPPFSSKKTYHWGFIRKLFNLIFYLLKTKKSHKIGKTFVQPKIIPPCHGY